MATSPRHILALVALLLFTSCRQPEPMLHTGDLLFVMGKGAMDQAIRQATGDVTHVAIVVSQGDSCWIYDATPRYGVRRVSHTTFLAQQESTDTIVAMRPVAPFSSRHLLSFLRQALGTPYDSAFVEGNSRYYCSELVKYAFVDPDSKTPLFPSKPMNWRDRDGHLPQYWTEWFGHIHEPIPEGFPGTNPNDLFSSPILQPVE